MTDLIEDADGARRAEAEGGWLAVVYPRDRNLAFVEAVERAPVVREFVTAQANGGTGYYVARIEIDSSVGRFEWQTDHPAARYAAPSYLKTSPGLGVLTGRLTLPDGSSLLTGSGGALFEAPGVVRAYAAWRESDVAGGWAVITEVAATVDEAWRPLLAALPLLFYTVPPTAR